MLDDHRDRGADKRLGVELSQLQSSEVSTHDFFEVFPERCLFIQGGSIAATPDAETTTLLVCDFRFVDDFELLTVTVFSGSGFKWSYINNNSTNGAISLWMRREFARSCAFDLFHIGSSVGVGLVCFGFWSMTEIVIEAAGF
jgi:hypothetical protein